MSHGNLHPPPPAGPAVSWDQRFTYDRMSAMKGFLEDQFGTRSAAIAEDYVDRVMGCLADGLDLLAKWEIEHREEGEREL